MIQNQKHQNKMWVIHSSGVEIVMQAQQENEVFCRPYMGIVKNFKNYGFAEKLGVH